jgi:hypothetical protein
MKIIILCLFAGMAMAASPSGTVVLAGSSSTITSADGTVWGLSAATAVPASGVQVVRNGKTDIHTAHVTEIAWVNGVIWQAAGGTWRPLPYPSATYWATDNINPLTTIQGPCPPPPPPVCPPPTTPTVSLTWSAVTLSTTGSTLTGPVTYNVYQGGTPASLAKIATGITSLSDTIATGILSGQTYYWTVSAVSGGVEGAQSNAGSKSF